MTAFIATQKPDRLLLDIGGTGIAAAFVGRQKGPIVVIRAELDALPIEEASQLPYASNVRGVSHTCGHDGHMATLAGLAIQLGRRRPARGQVWLLLQPAEETGEGAEKVQRDPRFAEIDADWIFALHNLPGRPLGEVVVRRGAFNCGSIGLIVRLSGLSSHAAHPEQGRSPAIATAQLIKILEALPETLDAEFGFSMTTVIHARLGEVAAFGTTPGEALIMATLRAEHQETLIELRAAAKQAVADVAAQHGLAHGIEWTEEYPVTSNHDAAVDLVVAAACSAGLDVVELDAPLRWSEDFGWFTALTPGALIGLGSGLEQAPLHSPTYDFPDQLIPAGVDLLMKIIDKAVAAT
jgi:amidohydrolase